MNYVLKATLFTVLFSLNSVNAFANSYQGLGTASVSPETIKKYEAKTLEPILANRIQKMLDIKSPGMGIITPDGKNLFFGWSITGTAQIWKLDSPKGFPVQVTGGDEQTRPVGMAPNGKFLIISRDANGEENPGLYTMSVEGGELLEIKRQKGVQVGYQMISDDSKWIYYSSNNISPDTQTLYRYNVDTKLTEQIFHDKGYWAITDFKGDSELILMKALSNVAQEYYTYNLITKKLTPILGQNEVEEYSISYGVKENEFFVITNKFGNFRRLYLYQSLTQKFTPITPDLKYDVEGGFPDRQKTRIHYSVNQDGYSKFYVIDAKTYKPIKMPEFKAIHTYLGSMSRNGRYMSIGVETEKAPRTSYIFDWKTKKLTQWVVPSTPEINTQNFVAAQLEYYTAKDGTKIPMFVSRPSQCINKTCPVVVHFHGGPEAQSTPGFSPYIQLFINEGFIFVEPNVRGSDGYGKEWLNSDNGAKRLNVISDIADCAEHIRKNWSFDNVQPKIGIMGGSYGGYSTLFGMSYYSGLYDAGVASVGMSNLITFLNNTAPYRRALRISEYGDPVKDKEALIQLSPITHVDKIKAPLLIVQGVNDPRVPVGESTQIQATLEKKKIASVLILFADEGHGASKRSNQVLEIGHTLGFFKKHLQK